MKRKQQIFKKKFESRCYSYLFSYSNTYFLIMNETWDLKFQFVLVLSSLIYYTCVTGIKIQNGVHWKKKQNKKNRQCFSNSISHDIQLCSWSYRDSSPLKVFKTYFVFDWVAKQNIPYQICNLSFCHSARDKIHFKDL